MLIQATKMLEIYFTSTPVDLNLDFRQFGYVPRAVLHVRTRTCSQQTYKSHGSASNILIQVARLNRYANTIKQCYSNSVPALLFNTPAFLVSGLKSSTVATRCN